MKKLKSYFFTNTNLNSRGKYISLKDNAEPNEVMFSDMLDSVVKPKVGSDYQDQADYNAINTKDSTKFTTAENLPEVDTTGSLLTITTTAAVDTNLLRRKKYTVAVNTPVNTSDISSRVDSKLVTPANLPKFALDNSLYSQQDGQVPYYDNPITETTDAGLFTIYKLKLKALTSEMVTHAGVKLDTVLNALRTDVDACVSDAELASAVSTLNTAIGLKANKVTPTFVTGYNGTKVAVNSQGVVTSVSKASALDITNDSSVSGSTVKDALNWLKANGGGGTGGASDTDGITNLSDVSGATATDAFNTLLVATQQITTREFVAKNTGDTIEISKFNVVVATADSSFTLPTADASNYGKTIVVANRSQYEVTINGIVSGSGGSFKLGNYNDTVQFVCLFDNVVTYGWWVLSDAMQDKIAGNKEELTGDYTAERGDNIKANALTVGADINITVPTAGIEGSVIYVYYPTGSPSAYVVELIGGYTATLVQGDWFLLRDNGSFWEAIGTSQNTVDLSAYATLASPTFTGTPSGPTAIAGTNTTQLATTAFVTSAISAIPSYSGTTNRITVSAGVIDISSAYVGQSTITTVGTLTSGALGSGFTAIADAQIASASTWNAKLGTSGGTLTGALNYPSFSTLASASTTNIGSVNNNYIEITGTTNITSFGTASAGVLKVLRFSGVLTISNNGTSLILPNVIDITTKANDIIEFISLGSGNWICTVVTQGSLGNYVDLSTAQTITGQKTFTRDTGSPTTGTATGTVITQLDCARIINAGKYIFYVSGDNVSIGKNAGHGSASLCTVMGSNAGNWSMSGQQNALYGYFAGNLLSSGSYNTVNGSQAGQSLTTGGYNVYSGFGAGYGAGGANSNNVYLGALSGDNKTESFRLRIHSATAFSSVPIIYGEFDNRVLRFDVNSLSIGSTNANALCALDIQSTTKGFKLPSVPTSAGLAATLAGNMRYNSTTVVPEYADGSRWVKLPKHYTQVTTKTIANTTTETSMFNDTGALGTRTIPGSSTQVGSYFRIRLDGYFGSTAGPFVTVQIKMGSVVIFDTTLTATYSPSGFQQWFIEAYFTVQSVGSGTSATVFGQGRFCYATSPSTQYNVLFTTNTAVSSGYDSTASQVLDVTFTWNTANAANTITTTNAVIEQIN